MTGDNPWRARTGCLRPFLDDQRVDEIFVDATGKLVVRSEKGVANAFQPAALSRAEVRGLARQLAALTGMRFGADAPRLKAPLDAEIEVELMGPPLVVDGPVIVFSRRRRHLSTLSELRVKGVIEPRIAMLVERALALRSSVIVVGPRRTPRRRMLSALTRSVVATRRVALFSPDLVPEDELTSRDAVLIASAEGIPFLPELGVDYVVADDPAPEVWAALFLGEVPFLAGLGAVELEVALERLIGLLISAKPGLGRAGAEALIAAAVDLAVELTPAADRDQVVALSEIERAGEILTPQRVVFLVGGNAELAIHGSKLERRFDRLEHPDKGDLRPAVRPPSLTAIPRRESVGPGSRAASAILGRGGIGSIPADTDQDLAAEHGLVGKVGRDRLGELRPEQLVSQSFIVDVSGIEVRPEVRLFDADADSSNGKDSDSQDVAWQPRTTANVPPPPKPLAPKDLRDLPKVELSDDRIAAIVAELAAGEPVKPAKGDPDVTPFLGIPATPDPGPRPSDPLITPAWPIAAPEAQDLEETAGPWLDAGIETTPRALERPKKAEQAPPIEAPEEVGPSWADGDLQATGPDSGSGGADPTLPPEQFGSSRRRV